MIEVQAGGGVVCRQKDGKLQVLLIFRRGVWDLPKGKKEEGEDIEACARREVAEETGLPTPDIEHFLIKTCHKYERDKNLYKKETFWYLMRTKKEPALAPQREEGITKVEWVEISRAGDKVGYNNLREVLKKVKPI